jgi:transposase
MSYSNDFRKCVLENISKGMSWNKACKVFSISRSSIASWLKNIKTRGEVSDSPRKAYKVRKIDSELLVAAINKTPDATLEELSEHFDCWPQSIHKRCVKLGITRKRNNIIRETK